MARMEIEMLERQSRSREAVENSVGQWNSLVSHRRSNRGKTSRVSNTDTNKTPSNPE